MDSQNVTNSTTVEPQPYNILAEAEAVREECREILQRVEDEQVESAKLLDLCQKTVLLSLGQTVTLEPKDYKGNLRKIADQLANDSGQLAADLRRKRTADRDSLEEIIRQAYFIGRKDTADNRPADPPSFLKRRIKQITTDIERQLQNGPLKPFNYEQLTK